LAPASGAKEKSFNSRGSREKASYIPWVEEGQEEKEVDRNTKDCGRESWIILGRHVKAIEPCYIPKIASSQHESIGIPGFGEDFL